MIEINFSNMMVDVIGTNGIAKSSIKKFSSRIEDAHKQIKDRAWSELAFIDLLVSGHFGDKKSCEAYQKNIRELFIARHRRFCPRTKGDT